MDWGALLLITAPYILISIAVSKRVIDFFKPKPKRPKLTLIKGGRYYEDKRGPYGKGR